MKELPIIFSTDMVKAILAEIKTKTRRLKGLEVINQNPDQWKVITTDLHLFERGILQNVFCVMFKPVQVWSGSGRVHDTSFWTEMLAQFHNLDNGIPPRNL